MKPFLLILFIPLFLSSCYNPTPSEIMNDIIAIEGSWKAYKGVSFSENWSFVNDSMLTGEGFSLNGNDTAFYETLMIIKKKDSIYYRVVLDDSNGFIDFILQDVSSDSWTFVNPDNDYPAIINYQIDNDSLLTITTSNIRGNKEQFFYLKKVNTSW